MYRVLIVEDSEEISELIKLAFTNEGFYCQCALDAAGCYKALKVPKSELPDLIILDINLPDVSGWDVCKRLKSDSSTKHIPIIMITGEYKSSIDVINGFKHGVDDFVTKPFNVNILVARATAVLRRTVGTGFNGRQKVFESDLLWSNGRRIIVNLASHSVSIKNGSGSYKEVEMTPKEYELLCLFLRKPNQMLSKKMLFETVWKEEYDETSRTLEKHIETLRRKLGKLSDKIITIPGLGYQFVND